MRKLVLFMHTSLDGFVAGPNGEMNWITVNEEIFDYAHDRTEAADTALYGRVTYQMMDAYWPTAGNEPDASKHDREHSAWYNKVQKVVLSRTLKAENLHNTTIIHDDLLKNITALKHQPGKEILMLGSPSAAHALMDLDLIDEYWLFVNPIVLGEGISLFKDVKNRKLKLLNSNSFSSGVVCLHYERLD
jgi:dihydrofolate reductase